MKFHQQQVHTNIIILLSMSVDFDSLYKFEINKIYGKEFYIYSIFMNIFVLVTIFSVFVLSLAQKKEKK